MILLKSGKAQTDICFQVNFDKQALEINSTHYISYLEDSLTITKLKFYITELSYFDDDSLIVKDERSYLIDINNKNSSSIKGPSNFNKIKFNLGVDSLTNVAGVQGGDLDPTKGMYWAWNSGYINFKLEGKCSILSTRQSKFQLHLGGFQAPFNSQRSIELKVNNNSNVCTISLPIDKFINQLDLGSNHTIMSPSEKTIEQVDILATLFEIVYE